MKVLSTFAIAAVALLGSGCDNITSSIKYIADAISSTGKQATDVGVISELGWLSKTLRDAAKGTPQERANARTTAIRLFGITDEELNKGGDLSLAVTIEFSGYDLKPEKPLQFSVRYTGSAKGNAMAKLFEDGNGWNPIDLVTDPMFTMNSDVVNAVIEQRLLALPVACGNQTLAFHLRKTTCSIGKLPKGSAETVTNDRLPINEPALKNLLSTNLKEFAKTLAITPDTPGLPTPQGSLWRYRINWGYGETNFLPYAVVFMPVAQVKNYPGLKVRAWLHLTADATRIVGVQRRPIVAADFAERCMNAVPNNPTPAVDSRTLAGPLCWYAFDLLGDGVRENILTVKREIENVDKDQANAKKPGT